MEEPIDLREIKKKLQEVEKLKKNVYNIVIPMLCMIILGIGLLGGILSGYIIKLPGDNNKNELTGIPVHPHNACSNHNKKHFLCYFRFHWWNKQL